MASRTSVTGANGIEHLDDLSGRLTMVCNTSISKVLSSALSQSRVQDHIKTGPRLALSLQWPYHYPAWL